MTYTLDELNEMMARNGGSLYLNGCTSLTSLPEGLAVGDWLYLSGCTSLTSLPEGLTVDSSLYLNGCTCAEEIKKELANFQKANTFPGATYMPTAF